MSLLLKQLHIHGFKSFAAPTSFVFDRGITAVVGPNGSGKSNVAEALRWVLGEQGHANLRSRRTEDVIFAGSEKRAQLGMAEVTLTLDNSAGELPLPFAEVTVARRAFRSGENQYLINGSRVRLKDVQQLVAPLGQAYTIIGQGLVDAALSQRPEERRGLFEHAAGIGGLRMRANEAERSLAEASGNALRLHDILGELEPRVRSLERQARQAREYGALRERLEALQRRYYGRLWLDSEAKLAAARSALKTADSSLETNDDAHERVARALGELRGDERRLAEEAARTATTVAELERALADQRHHIELLAAAEHAARQRVADLDAARHDLEQQGAEAAAETENLAAQLKHVGAELTDLTRLVSVAEDAGRAARDRRAELERTLAESERRARELTRATAESEGNINSLDERRVTLEADVSVIEAATEREVGRVDELAIALAEAHQRLSDITIERERVAAEHAARECELDGRRGAVLEQGRQVEHAERELARLRARLEMLEGAWASGEGLYSGVRAVLRAARSGKLELPGLLGTVAELVDVPAEYETAIEVALGGHLQDIVVRAWRDAEIGIAFLKRSNAGRATFQPLDSLRSRSGRARSLELKDADVHGIAVDLITYPADAAPVVSTLLGATLVVTDLPASRRILGAAGGWTIVTLAGEITRPAGSVTGGSRTADAGLLARERERRALPATISGHERALAGLRAALQDAEQATKLLAGSLAETSAKLDRLRSAAREQEADIARLERERDAADAAVAGHAERRAALDRRLGELRATLASAREKLTVQQEELRLVRLQSEEFAARLASSTSSDDTAASLRTQLAALTERRTAMKAAQRATRQRAEHATQAAMARSAEIARVRAAVEQDAARTATHTAEIARLEQLIAAARSHIPPLDESRVNISSRLAEAERDLDRATAAVREAERDRDRASLALARCQDEQVFLAERVRNDLGLEDPVALTWQPAPDDADEAMDPSVEEQEIGRLRERLRRMSSVGEDVLEQYAAESERLSYLGGQLEDVEQAANGLRAVLAELNERMSARFADTFREVAAAFEQTFQHLFGGGQARLVLSGALEGDEMAAIDIVAQPPGKRLASLSALSGGERALTAVALLLAIQRVNPSPFCLLDEVDAALDETNVLRFRDEVRDLASTTQFIIITHNRGTIEGADTLYGVTMGADSVSRVLSLRLGDT